MVEPFGQLLDTSCKEMIRLFAAFDQFDGIGKLSG
jgi:hypothetical protein